MSKTPKEDDPTQDSRPSSSDPMGPPSVTLAMPSYNQAQFLEQAILSVISQDYPTLEFVVRDGGSTDGSVDIIQSYEQDITRWESGTDGGQASAINDVWANSSGDLLGWLNSDDVLAPSALQRVARAAQDNPHAVLFFGDCAIIDEQGRQKEVVRKEGFDRDDLLIGRSLAQPSVFIRRCVIEDLGLLDSALHYAMDWSYFLKVFWSYPESRIHYIPAVLSGSREYEGTKSRTGLSDIGEERRKKLYEYIDEGVLPRNSRVVSRGLAGTYWKQGTNQFLSGNYIDAFKSGFKAIKHAPSTLAEKIPRALWLLRERYLRI